MRILILGLMATFVFNAVAVPQSAAREESCRKLLDYIYKELTLQNMDKSVKRLNYKMVLALAQVLRNVDERRLNLRRNPEVLSLVESMADIDSSLAPWLDQNAQYRKYQFWNFLPFNRPDYKKVSYQRIIKKWKDLQSRRPSLFEGLEKKYLLDGWDLKTSNLLENYSALEIAGHELQSSLEELAERYAKNLKEIDGGRRAPALALHQTKASVDRLHENFNKEAGKIVASALDNHSSACSSEEFHSLLSRENLSCPVARPESAAEEFSGHLQSLSKVISAQLINSAAPPAKKLLPKESWKFLIMSIRT